MVRTRAEWAVMAAGLALLAVLVAGVLLAMANTSYDHWGGLIVAPVLVAVTLPTLSRQAAREGDRKVFWILLAALLLKFVGSLARLYASYLIYGGRWNDAAVYHDYGVGLAERFWSGDFSTGLDSLTGTNFLRFFPGVVYSVIGPTRLGGYFVFSWLAFWGVFSFYRAFTIAVPEGSARTYARWLFFLPSLIYWPSSIGKDAWMIFGLGIGALGAAHLMTGKRGRGLLLVAIGIFLTSLVRSHIAAMLALAVGITYVIQSLRRTHPPTSLARRFMPLAALAVFLAIALPRMEQFLSNADIDTSAGLVATLQSVSETTDEGGSSFKPAVLTSPTGAPLAIVTVLFRPFPFEAHNWQALIAGLEGAFMLLILVLRFRSWGAVARTFVRRGYVLFAVCYMAMFIVAFSSVGNFGILSRQRVQVLPFFLILFGIMGRRPTEPVLDAEPVSAIEPVYPSRARSPVRAGTG